MTTTGRPHRISDIAAQAGLSRATVDRVLHARLGVRPATASQVEQAIVELDRQQSQVRLSGRTFLIDLVMQTPRRFGSASQSALESALPGLRPAVFRARFHLTEESDADRAAATLDAIRHRGSSGVILKAPDDPRVVEAVHDLATAGVPVVTFVTDLPFSGRVAYVGVDNRAAGATAAYLVTQWATGDEGGVLVTLSSSSFRGEEEREIGFRATLRDLAPARTIHEVTGTDGLDSTMLEAVGAALEAGRSISAVYSVGGGNSATLAAFRALGRTPQVFVAHDLDDDNRALLRTRQVSAVLHHDLRADMRRACRLLMQAQGALPGSPLSIPSQVQIITPFNEPAGLIAADSR
ncbi:LacI family DNA-binding transcriptional regulator [Angustibacter sp. McL0619]|uniref:LacI family DNA-binding transcriptional regulator n=1 Tax=Angustibacter sp. McL0619 TaxID=3415676 RepID=UPI003CF9E0B1